MATSLLCSAVKSGIGNEELLARYGGLIKDYIRTGKHGDALEVLNGIPNLVFSKLNSRDVHCFKEAFYGYDWRVAGSYFRELESSHKNTMEKLKTRVIWTPPRKDFLKLNVDGSCSGGKGGFGGLFRSPAGHIYSFYAKYLNETTSFQAELLSVQAGLHIILNKSLMKIELETDNEQIARILRQDEKINKVDPVLTDVMTKLTFASEHLYDIRINHIYRAANCCANYLANNARVLKIRPPIRVNRRACFGELKNWADRDKKKFFG